MRHPSIAIVICLIVCGPQLFGQESRPPVTPRVEKIDSAVIARIIDEGMNHLNL